jgi:hypothetical protein
LDDAKWNAFIANPDAVTLQNDPAYYQASTFARNYTSKYASKYSQFSFSKCRVSEGLYLKGIMEMDPAKAKMMYPDATFHDACKLWQCKKL